MSDRSDDTREEAHLAAEFLAWSHDEDTGLPIDATQPWRDIRIEPEETAILQLERVVEFRSRALAGDTAYWLDAVRSAHLCLTAVMVSALEGSAGVGAMTPKAAGATLKYLSRPDRASLPWPREHMMPFSDLLEAVQTPGRLEIGEAVMLTDEQKVVAKLLNWLRELIDHPKFTRWSIPISDFDETTALPFALIERMMNCAPQRYGFGDARRRVASALATFRDEIAP